VFFDGVQLWFGIKSEESQRIFIYSRFLYAVLYPLAAWDVFEEMRAQIQQMRRLALARLVTGVVFAGVIAVLISLSLSVDDGQSAPGAIGAVMVWALSSVATLGFLWSLHRAIQTRQMAIPNNTSVWTAFLQLSLVAELAACFAVLLGQLMGATSASILDVCLMTYGFGITVWCTARLKRIPSNVPTTANEGTA
jgi:hypothetical protein